jgi:hypothetical protein
MLHQTIMQSGVVGNITDIMQPEEIPVSFSRRHHAVERLPADTC